MKHLLYKLRVFVHKLILRHSFVFVLSKIIGFYSVCENPKKDYFELFSTLWDDPNAQGPCPLFEKKFNKNLYTYTIWSTFTLNRKGHSKLLISPINNF